ncbi:MAG: 50S ribosomal protein L13 [bacterium]|nr:50S ribosomal protein L13 [bacterium]
MEYQIDATNKVFGRLATEIANLLRGKNLASYEAHLLPKHKVVISGVKNIAFSGKKEKQKKYYHYSGYPGGMKTRVLENEFEKNPGRVLRAAVYGMLPKNRLRDKIIKNLIIKS